MNFISCAPGVFLEHTSSTEKTGQIVLFHSQASVICRSVLTAAQRQPGQGHNRLSYIVTHSSFQPVEVKLKTCTNKNCKAMHQEWPMEQGTFTSYRVCAQRPCWRTKTIENICIKIEYISQRKIIVLFRSSNMAVVQTLYWFHLY